MSLILEAMFFLTRREQCVIVCVLLTFLIGMGVKQWRQITAVPNVTAIPKTII